MLPSRPVILGSSSKWRASILSEHGIPIAGVLAPDIDEKAIRHDDPRSLVMAISRAKMDAVLSKFLLEFDSLSSPSPSPSPSPSSPSPSPSSLSPASPTSHELADPIIITCDEVIMWKDELREKPEDAAECKRFLRSYAEAPAVCVCGVVVCRPKTGQRLEGTEEATVHFKPMSEADIAVLVDQQGVGLASAGGFEIENMEPFVARIDGDPDTVRGLPMSLVKSFVSQLQ